MTVAVAHGYLLHLARDYMSQALEDAPAMLRSKRKIWRGTDVVQGVASFIQAAVNYWEAARALVVLEHFILL